MCVLLLFSPSLRAQTALFYQGVSVDQVSSDAFVGQQQAKILKITIQVGGSLSNDSLRASKFNFSLKGTTNRFDLTQAKLYYTGTKDYTDLPLLSNDTVGNVVKSFVGKFSILLNRPLVKGKNYFWLTYDLSTKAIPGDFLDATMDSFIVGDTLRYPAVASPAGKREIKDYESFCPIKVKFKSNPFLAYLGLREVNIGSTIANKTTDLDTLTFYSGQMLKAYRGESYPVSIKCGQGFTEKVSAWVDWNGDGYLESSEQVFGQDTVYPGQTYKNNLTIPCSAVPGMHKIRIVSDYLYSSPLTPCGNLWYGEGEEYLIEVLPDPVIAASFVTDTPAYVNSPVVFRNTSTVNGKASYEWDYTNDGFYDDNTATGNTVYTSPGTYAVKLRLNYTGCDTSYTRYQIQNIRVINPPATPVTDFIALEDSGTLSTIFRFRDLSSHRPNKWLWEISPDSANGSLSYIFHNGTSAASPNPEIQFRDTGHYTISLTTWNGKGQGTTQTISRYIHVLYELDMCRIANFTDTVRTNEGILYDDGGPDNAYGYKHTCSLVIKPPCAKNVYLTFSSFDASIFGYTPGFPGGDYLKVYDGIDNKGRALHDSLGYTNGFQNQAPSNKPITIPILKARSGSFYIEWNSDSFYNGEGFVAHWFTDLWTSTPPKASFSGPDTIYRSQAAEFFSTSSGEGLEYFWDFNGDGRTDELTANPIFPFYQAGTYKVRLIVRNCGGMDTAYKNLVVKVPKGPPVAAFVADNVRVGTGDLIQLTDQSTEGPYEWDWIITRVQDGKRLARFYKSYEGSQNPVIYFQDTGIYNITLGATNEYGTNYRSRPRYISVYSYCTPDASNPSADLGASRVVITNIQGKKVLANSTTTSQAFEHPQTTNIPYLDYGANFKMRVSRVTHFNKMNAKVWIDYNSDGDFTDAGEEVISVLSVTDSFWAGSFTIPSGAAKGITRLRIGTDISSVSLTPCGSYINAEFEDYTVYIGPDTVKPIIKLTGGDTVKLEEERLYIDPGYSASDNVDGDITKQVSLSNNIDPIYPGYYQVTYKAKDKAGNITTRIRTVLLIADTTAPTISLKGNKFLYSEVHKPYIDPGALVNDNISNFLTLHDSGYIDTAHLGIYRKYYIATDGRGNQRTIYRVVVVGDSTRPTLSLKGPPVMSVQVLHAFNDPGVDVSDNYSHDIVPVESTDLDTSKLGTYIIYYSAIDSSGNGPVTITRTVLVTDTIKPVLHMPNADVVWDAKVTYKDPPYWLADNYFHSSEVTVLKKGEVNIYRIGDYPLAYYALDPAGNASDSVKFTVHVVDRIAPEIVLAGPVEVTVPRWGRYIEPGFTMYDNYDDDPMVTVGGTYKNADKPGIYFRSYQVSDHSGNASKIIFRYIYVEDSYSDIQADSVSSRLISLYPNPANEYLNIGSAFEQPKEFTVTVQTVIGQVLDQKNIRLGKGLEGRVDVHTLAPGLYYLRLEGNGYSLNRSFIITR